ncbi:hypothetical protein [Jeotgalibacillus soli]|uniref:Uncharacterized protein n=1 Tax=Jeotgalibacillus soli TaxID=889306 RepID=A0A0C2RNE3_9BACL|nr:hypothetical protein [Jeotgalibacillus soli]KIL51795.1 hypothetical protein KP78_01650 [Jeotgalibacillus soli]
MNRFSTVSTFFNQLISENERFLIADKHNYGEEGRKFGVRNLDQRLLEILRVS